MHSLLVAQSYSKYLPFLLMSESPCLPITPFHVLLLVFTCAFKPPFVDSANATFCKATPTLSKEGLYCVSVFGAHICKMHSDRSCSLSIRRQIVSPSGIQSVTQWTNEDLQDRLPLPEQTWLHLNLNRKAFSLYSIQQY